MKRFVLSLVLGVVVLAAVAMTPSRAEAQWRWRRAYYPAYSYYYPTYSYYPTYGYGWGGYYPSFGYTVPSYYGTYVYPSYNAYTLGTHTFINPGYNYLNYYSPGYTYVPGAGPIYYYP